MQPALTSKFRIHDTCGVNNLHGMPAILSALCSAIYAAMAGKEDYKDSLTSIFPAMDAAHNGTASVVGVIITILLKYFLLFDNDKDVTKTITVEPGALKWCLSTFNLISEM